MNAKHILVANALASYRESIAAVLRSFRPDAEVFEADSGEMDREILRIRPDLVICGRVTSLVRERVPNWVELYPECEPHSTICVDGECSAAPEVELSDLLSVVDRVRPLAPLG